MTTLIDCQELQVDMTDIYIHMCDMKDANSREKKLNH